MSTLQQALPLLEERKRVSEEDIAFSRNNGHVLIISVLSPEEIAAYRPAILATAEKYNTENRKLEDRDTYGKAFLLIMNLWGVDPAVRNVTLAKRFARVAADWLGMENVRIYHDQALFKEASGGFTPWHQDPYYWPLDTNNTVTMWMPLIDIDEQMDMLTFASGSHRSDLQRTLLSQTNRKKSWKRLSKTTVFQSPVRIA